MDIDGIPKFQFQSSNSTDSTSLASRKERFEKLAWPWLRPHLSLANVALIASDFQANGDTLCRNMAVSENMVYHGISMIPPFLASFWKGTWSSTIRFRGMVYKFYFQTDPYSMAISGTYINWRYLVPIPYVRPKLSGNIPTIHMANKMCPAAMAGSPPSIMSSWCLGWCSDLVGTVVLDESPVTTAWKPPLFRDI